MWKILWSQPKVTFSHTHVCMYVCMCVCVCINIYIYIYIYETIIYVKRNFKIMFLRFTWETIDVKYNILVQTWN